MLVHLFIHPSIHPSSVRSRFGLRVLAASAVISLGLGACGGGGGGGTSDPVLTTQPVPNPAPVPSVTLDTPSSAKAPWNLLTPISVTLRDSAGAVVGGAVVCTSPNPVALTVAQDCSSVTGKRLGTQTIAVSAGNVTANAVIKVIPQAQPIGSQGVASSGGSGQYNLVVTPAGKVLAWGANGSSVLGQGQTGIELTYLALPAPVKDQSGQGELTGIVAVAAGSLSALALTEDGEVWSWGSNDNGQLGRTSTNSAPDPLPGKVRNPSNNGDLSRIVAVSAGDDNAVALADDGTVYTWGYYSGQTGPDPKRVPGLVNAVGAVTPLSNVVAVSAGWNWSAALTGDGRVVTWGYNGTTSSYTGQGSTASVVPTTGYVVAGNTVSPITGVVSISAGYNFGMAITTGGEVFAWGDNWQGQSGQNTQDYPGTRGAVMVKSVDGTGLLGNIKMVAAGGNHALALDNSGNVYSWGLATNGQLGDGVNRPTGNLWTLPRAVVGESGVPPLTGMAAIAAGYSHSLALAPDGRVLIWGAGFRGNLGQGNGLWPDSAVPLAVKDIAGTGVLFLEPSNYWPNLTRRGR